MGMQKQLPCYNCESIAETWSSEVLLRSMMSKVPKFEPEKLFEGSLRRLQTEAKYFSRSTTHKPELGRLNETHLVRLLRDYLPARFGIGTGFIVCGGANPAQSPQCDIIIYDAINNAPLYKSEAWSVYPIEMVYGVIEVKTTLNKPALREAFETCARIRIMAGDKDAMGNKSYLRQVQVEPRSPVRHEEARAKLPPRFFVFAYRGWKTAAALEANFRAVSDEMTNAHIHGICSLSNEENFYVSHRAFAKGDEKYAPVVRHGFRRFLLSLPLSLSSMLPLERQGLGFEQVNLGHYYQEG